MEKNIIFHVFFRKETKKTIFGPILLVYVFLLLLEVRRRDGDVDSNFGVMRNNMLYCLGSMETTLLNVGLS